MAPPAGSRTLVMCQVAIVGDLGDLAAEASTIRLEFIAFVFQAHHHKLVVLSLNF
jgi:hypothetical protein